MPIYPNMPAPERAYNRVADIFLKETHYTETSDNAQAHLRDLLTDLRHYTDFQGLDFHQAIDGSYEVYLKEKKGDD